MVTNRWARVTDAPDKDTSHQIAVKRRQLVAWGFDHLADSHEDAELVQAALAYLCTGGEVLWPFDQSSFMKSDDPIENLIWAGALLATEGDRILRARLAGRPVTSGMIVLAPEPEEISRCVEGLRQIEKEIDGIRAAHT